MSTSAISVKTGTGGSASVATITLADGITQAIAHVLCDGTATPYSQSNPLPSAPAISPVNFTDHTGTITAANASAAAILADATRKGGFIRALPTNAGTISVTLTNAANQTHTEILEPGDQFSMTVNGYVIQVAIAVSGNTVGDGFSGVTYS